MCNCNCNCKSNKKLNVKVKYIDPNIGKLIKTEKGDLIDLRASEVTVNGESIEFDGQPIYYKAGDVVFIKLGIAMEMPKGYTAKVYPRSSTFKNYGLILTNSTGCIDQTYCSDSDQWCAMFYAIKDGKINYNDRVCQFEIHKSIMNDFTFNEVDNLNNETRGGYGSTGVE